MEDMPFLIPDKPLPIKRRLKSDHVDHLIRLSSAGLIWAVQKLDVSHGPATDNVVLRPDLGPLADAEC
jgi:hypothetical protein